MAYGLAFAGIYRVEDSRIQAARWIFAVLPSGQNIGVETGAFSVQGLIDGQRYGKHFIGSSRLFSTRGYLTCATGVDYSRGPLSDVRYVAITDVNRYRQYAAVAGLFPVLHDCYTKLVAGELGGLAYVLQREDLDRAKVFLQEIETDYPDMRLAALVAADLYGKLVKKKRDSWRWLVMSGGMGTSRTRHNCCLGRLGRVWSMGRTSGLLCGQGRERPWPSPVRQLPADSLTKGTGLWVRRCMRWSR